MKIKKIIKKDNEEITLGDLSVLVGPNNVGKSQVLRDIHENLNIGKDANTVLIDQIKIEDMSYEDFKKHVHITKHPTKENIVVVKGIDSTLVKQNTPEYTNEQLIKHFETNNWDFLLPRSTGRFLNALLNAETRLAISTKKPSKITKDPPQNLLQVLYDKPEEYDEKLDASFKTTFEKKILLQMDGPELVFKIADEFNNIPSKERDAAPILENYNTLDVQGDGFRSFVSVMLGILLLENRVILIDEPEAFLHPAQARFLGSKIREFANNINSQIIISTHSADILDGILTLPEKNSSAKLDIKIFRLDRTENITKINEISSNTTKEISNTPILSSQSVYESIFYEGVVICEGDNDRSVYEAIYSKIFHNKKILFIHTFGKQNIERVIKILKDAKIPVCAIVDIDILNSEESLQKLISRLKKDFDNEILESRNKIANHLNKQDDNVLRNNLKTELKELLDQLNNNKHSELSYLKSALERIKDNTSKWKGIKQNGINSLPKDLQEVTKNLLSSLKNIGLFVVPVGELEQWIPLDVKKQKWAVQALEKLESEETPQSVKSFITEVKQFLDRK